MIELLRIPGLVVCLCLAVFYGWIAVNVISELTKDWLAYGWGPFQHERLELTAVAAFSVFVATLAGTCFLLILA